MGVSVVDRKLPSGRLDRVAVEEPLEIRVAGEPVAITMRTPGADEQLALGFLHAEGIIRTREDVGSVSHCGRPGDEGFGNSVDVIPAAGVVLDLEKVSSARRGTLTTAACGVCGRRTVDDLFANCGPVPDGTPVSRALVAKSPQTLRSRQTLFDQTGGVHGAAALSVDGDVLASFEDVGRHNAVDKVVGALLLEDRRAAAAVLVVSGRASFEIIQKAAMARIPVVSSVSAASSLAIDLAERTRVALAAFTRDGAFNLYTHSWRIQP